MVQSKSYLPSSNYTKSFWLSLEDQDPFSKYQHSPRLPKETDILIIGSGYAGASTVYNLLKQDPSLDVTLLEARTTCSGATGRNGGHLKPYGHREYSQYEESFGSRIAADIVNSEVDHLYTIKDLVEKEGIDCDFVLTRAFDVYKESTRFENDVESLAKLESNPYVKQEIKDSIQVLEGDSVSTLSKVSNVKRGITYPAAHLWPWKLVTSLLKKSVSVGLKLYTNTTVIEVSLVGNKYKIVTEKGSLFAKKVVFATNAYTKALLPEFKDAITPVKGVVTHIKSLDKPIPQLPNTYGIFHKSGLYSEYLINRADGGIIVGGGSVSMIDGTGDYSEVYDNPDDSYYTSKAKEYFQNYAPRTFTTWKNSKSDITWSGIMGYTSNGFPFVGDLGFINQPNAYIVAGFSGHGMPRVYLSGKAIADSIITGNSVLELDQIPENYVATLDRLKNSKEKNYKIELINVIKSKL
ncbi:putative oxidoreductase ordL [Wickerhamomyces ciferrii]|uniref:Oxidoreductase ordL n=1 Tax=Wickerhamomyces ciferrii (strain ATCC 14091 / BCRC 22168 / CBS 111 / JCM 3599 / NBRC 0793 / NRRL Y-1031 F-60-10) TaxID=1206466 RepID=K0KL35_WICCF|nr:putative oxidoreductase ordL [Wickerhamomyces ciferrii]CCH42882.1 putative oxidoreductase ordL [Wickerhamomyces ciferrii]